MRKTLLFLFAICTTTVISQTNPTGLDNTVNTNEDIDRILSAADFGYFDADGDPFTQIQIFSTVSVGALFLDANDDNIIDGGEAVANNDIIVIGDINLNRLKFRPVANANGASYDDFRFYVNDGNDGNSILNYLMDINVNAVNDDPVLVNNLGITVNEGSTNQIVTTAMLQVTDIEQAPAAITYTVTAIPANGNLQRIAATLGIGNTFTQADIDANLINYDHDGSETISDSYTFTVADGAGGSIVATAFTITVTPQNDNPVLATNTGKTVNEGATTQIIPNTELQVTDVDNTDAQIIYTLTAVPGNGTLYNGVAPSGIAGTFTQSDINANNINYTHDGSETISDSFTFTVADGAGGNIGATAFNITVTPQNDNPVVVTNTGQTVNEGAVNQTVVITELQTTDVDNTPAQLTYTLTAIPANGTIDIGGPALGIGGTFTQNDINSNLLEYDHDGSETITDAFTFTIADGAGGTVGATSFIITITPQNDNPVLATNTGKTVNEGATTQIIPNTELQVTDVDNTDAQIIYTLTAVPGNGTLYNGVAPSGIAGTFTQSDINANNINYTHDGSETISDSFTFTVADGAGGNIGATVFNITVTPQNDNPTIATNTGKTVNEGDVNQNVPFTELQAADVDNTPAQLTYTLSAIPVYGSIDIGGPALGIGGTFTQANINANLLRYTHDGTENFTDAFTFTVTDGAGGSTVATTFNITITPQNDAPVIGANTGLTSNEGVTNQIIANTALRVDDPDNTAVEITYTLTLAPSNGTLYNGATPLGGGSTFTQNDIDGNNLTYTHDGSETLADNFQFTVADGAGGNVGVTTFNITVNPVNDDPVFSSIPIIGGQEGVLYTYNITTTDADLPGDALTITAPTIPGWLGILDNGDGTATLSGTPPDGALRTNPVIINVNDGTTDIQQSYTLAISYDISVPGNYATIQLAIDNSQNDDLISVGNGTYNENINFNGKEVEIVGNIIDPSQVIIDGGGTGSVVTIASGEAGITTLNGFTIRNGAGTLGVPAVFSPYAPSSGYYGGGIYCYQSNPLLKNLIVENNNVGESNNHGGSGAGIYIGNNSNVTIEGPNTIIRNNTTTIYRGGGICIDNSIVIIDGTVAAGVVIDSNSGGNYGGGIAGFVSTITLTDVDINNNDSSGTNGVSGGFFHMGCGVPSETNVNYSGNTSTN